MRSRVRHYYNRHSAEDLGTLLPCVVSERARVRTFCGVAGGSAEGGCAFVVLFACVGGEDGSRGRFVLEWWVVFSFFLWWALC